MWWEFERCTMSQREWGSKEKGQNRAGQLDRTPLATPPVGCVRGVDGAACGAEGDHDLGPRGECLPRLSFDPPPPPARLAPGTGRQAAKKRRDLTATASSPASIHPCPIDGEPARVLYAAAASGVHPIGQRCLWGCYE